MLLFPQHLSELMPPLNIGTLKTFWTEGPHPEYSISVRQIAKLRLWISLIQEYNTMASPLTDTYLQRTPSDKGQMFSSQVHYEKNYTFVQRTIHSHLSTTHNNICPTGVRYVEIPMYSGCLKMFQILLDDLCLPLARS